VLVLSRAETQSLLDLDALRIALAGAMRAVSAGRVSMPARIAALVPERGLLAAMPAYLAGDGALAAKLVSLFPANAGTALPTHQAVIVMFDPDNGEPVALMDGTWITTARTAAGSALSADLLARPDAQILAILGTGVQARAHAQAMVRVRPIRTIRVAGRHPERAADLAADLRAELAVEVQTADSFAQACLEADIICAATHSTTPVVQRDFLPAGVHVTSVGYNPAGREIDSGALASAVVVVESREAALAAPPAGSNDLRMAIEEGLIGPDHIHAEVGELLAGTRPGRASPDQITLYKSVGIAAQDVAAAALVLAAARAAHAGITVAL
jgi:ornithine cyclodeaminase/alanine dehydrogenase-like protein (mu-crystallin family)